MWIYLTGRTEERQIVLYEYQAGRKGEYPKEFLEGFSGYLHCDGYSGYGEYLEILKKLKFGRYYAKFISKSI